MTNVYTANRKKYPSKIGFIMTSEIDKLSQILPAFYVLASGDWIRTRNDIHQRYENEEVWIQALNENGLSSEVFDVYESWWNSPRGYAVIKSLKNQFLDSILETDFYLIDDEAEEFLRNYANWDDFIRELSFCTLDDAEATNGQVSYFTEHAIEQALCNSVIDSSVEFDQDLIVELVESWFKTCYEETRIILLSAYDEIAKVGLLN